MNIKSLFKNIFNSPKYDSNLVKEQLEDKILFEEQVEKGLSALLKGENVYLFYSVDSLELAVAVKNAFIDYKIAQLKSSTKIILGKDTIVITLK